MRLVDNMPTDQEMMNGDAKQYIIRILSTHIG
jgi:hypothetical protein